MSTTATRSKVVIQDTHQEPVVGVAAQLLGVLGHEVDLVETADAALVSAENGPTDLLVLSAADFDEQRQRLDQIALLPRSSRPKQVAILSDADADEHAVSPRSLPGIKVHVFAKPVRAHGLLNVIKRLAATN